MAITTNRIIKKYPNRRLYDTEISRYITLEDVKELVLQNIPFHILDAKSQADLTNTTLLQIITELEQQGVPLFTNAMLQQIIRLYGNDMQKMMSQFLEQTVFFFKDQPSTQLFQELSAQQMQLWQKIQKQWQELIKKQI